MANQYRFLPDFSVFENDEQNDVSTEDTGSSIMSRNRQVDTDTSGTGGDFLERFHQNLRAAFNDDDKFKQTFMSKKRPKPDISEIRSYVDRVKGSSDIEDALLEATGMYNPGMASDDNSMTIKDASDGITVPKQPDVMVDELSSGLGSYLRNRANKGSSFVGEGVQMASAGSLSVEDMDLARMMAGQTMRKEAAEMGLPVVDMEEEAKKSAVEAARERAKKGITQSKGAPQGLMSPVASDPRVDTAASGLNEDDPLGRVRPKARPEVATDFNFKDTSIKLVSDLMRDFNLNKTQAAALVGNLAWESDNYQGMQEYKPTVKGSRGGYGFAQWTGARRRMFESWAKENELDPNSYEANYGFLKFELSRANDEIGSMGVNTIKKLKKTKDLDTATSVVMNEYLRPGIPHEEKRRERSSQVLGLLQYVWLTPRITDYALLNSVGGSNVYMGPEHEEQARAE